MHQVLLPTPAHIADLDRLGDEIAELSAHLDAATARLLALIREFDARGGWANGCRSCAEWLSERYQVVVHVDAAVLADPDQPGQSALEDGVHVSAETSRRLACEATRVVLRHTGDGQVLDVGRRTRTIPPALRRALEARDRGCRFPGCGVRHAQGHHIHHWANGGPTRLDNLALLCRRHHRAVHEEGYTVVRDADGRLCFSTPRGRPIPEVPAPPAMPPDAARTLVASNRAHGLAIDARTGVPSWCGERLDLGWAIGVLHPACQPAAPRAAGG